MNAQLRYLHSPDVDDLASWSPVGDFAILLQMLVGPEGGRGEESFDITLCTAGLLADRVREARIVDGRHHVIVDEYDYIHIKRYLTQRVAACKGQTWDEIAKQLARLGHWEFEDYREYQDPDPA